MIATEAKTRIRNLRDGEDAPLDTALLSLKIDPEWCWVAEYDDRVVGCVLAANAHGICILLRILAIPPCPPNLPMLLLRQVFRDARKRGCFMWASVLSDHAESEVKLARVAARYGAKLFPFNGVFVAGSLEVK